jgi:hypothetical protein
MNQANDTRMADLIKEAEALGGQAALGADTKTKAYLAIIKAQSAGLNLLDKDSEKVDGIDKFYDGYKKGMGKKQIHEYAKDGDKANKSKMRVCAKAVHPGGAHSFEDTVDKLLILHKAEQKLGNPIHGSANAIVNAARVQAKQETALTDAQIAEAVAKAAQEITVEDELKRIAKALERVVTGENKHGLRDNHELTTKAAEALNARVAMFVRDRAEASVREAAAALGWTMVETSVETSVAAE